MPFPRHRWTVLLLFTLVIVGACRGPIRVNMYPDPPPTMAGYRTYSWISRTLPTEGGQPSIAGLDTRIRSAVDANLSLKGYLQRPLNVPDFLVGYRTAIQYKSPESVGDLYNYRQAGGEQGPQEVFGRGFEEGLLTLEFIDAQSRQVLWRASAATVLGETPSRDQVAEAVRLLLERLPPAQ